MSAPSRRPLRRAVSPEEALLREGYRRCARITRTRGTTYHWGARLLPPASRRHVYAVYALCRLADDIVDAPGATDPERLAQTEAALAAFRGRFCLLYTSRCV